MKEFEMRKTKGYCRLCQYSSDEEMVVIPFRYAGKSAPILLCKDCVKHLYEAVSNEVRV